MKEKFLKKGLWQKAVLMMAVLVACVMLMPMSVAAGEVTSGTLGDNGGITWTYDESTKTLTVTGEDSGLAGKYVTIGYRNSLFVNICSDVEKIVIKDCKILGDATGMFAGLRSLNSIEVDNFTTSEITNMSYMFQSCDSLNSIDLSGFNTSNVTDMSHMFQSCDSLNSIDLSGVNADNVTDMSYMFDSCDSLKNVDLDGLNTGNLTNVQAMFYYCKNLTSLDLSDIDTSNVEIMQSMFEGCSNLVELNLTGFDTSKVTDMYYMFRRCSSLESLDLSDFNTFNVKSMRSMFEECSNLISLSLSSFNTSNVTDMSSMFQQCKGLINLDVSSFNTSSVSNISGMFCGCNSLTELNVSNFDTSNVKDMTGMFQGCVNLTELNVSNFDTSNVTSMSSMFADCKSLKDIDLSGFDTSNVTKMSHMFSNCINVTELDLSNFNTGNVTYMWGMFQWCYKLEELNISSFDTSNVTDMSSMFGGCNSLINIDVSSFDTSNATDMSGMFGGCNSLINIDISNFDTSNVTDMSGMFRNCNSLTSLDLSNFDTAKVDGGWTHDALSYMFCGCSRLESLDISSFDMSNMRKTYFRDMLTDCVRLTKIYTPAVIPADIQVKLPGEFTDSNQNKTSILTAEFCNDMLTRGLEDVAVERIEISDSNLLLVQGDTYTLSAVVYPENALYKKVEWSSSNSDVATVDSTSGMVTAIAIGKADIIVTSMDNSEIVAKCAVEVQEKNPFADVPVDTWYFPYVLKAYNNGYMTGTGKDAEGKIIFKPLANVTREQFVQILYNIEGTPAVQYQNIFPDVPEQSGSAWYSNAIMWAVQNNIVSGYDNGMFGVGDNITREQVAVILLKYAAYRGYDTSNRANLEELREAYLDVDDIHDWAADSMCWAVKNGVMKGTAGGKLMPLGNASRAEAATMLLNMLSAYGE